MDTLPAAFEALAKFQQFIVYKLSPSKTRSGKIDKLPFDPRSHRVSNAHDPKIWLSATQAIKLAKQLGEGYGVGFVFTKDDPFWFIDIDDCLEPCITKWNDIALSLLSIFSGAAVEVSTSGKGLHIIGTGEAPPHACRNAAFKLEFYTTERFVALTGMHATGSASLDCTHLLPWLVNTYFQSTSKQSKAGESTVDTSKWTNTPCSK
jgi:primase-polymerase (primpol)-like protein